ncbi:MAG: hypothetical protein CMB56_007675 [Methanobacteriota archaeon]|nr:MAG: hypothetical protein CMB56_007675 [Euryarchaeota archaeon]
MRKSEKGNLFNLFTSIISMFLVFSLVSTTIGPHLVTSSLISSDLISNPRYGITFPALETIEEMDEDAVIAIGSSIIRDAIDGKCISENLNDQNTNVFNLGISGALPYTEILQIPAIIKSNPELVVIELGPNGLFEYGENDTFKDEYIRFRFTINSIAMDNSDVGNWTKLIRETDREWIAFNNIERMELTKSYSQETIEDIFKSKFFEYSDLINYDKKYPVPGEKEWVEFIMSPFNFFEESTYLETKSEEEVNSFFEEIMPKVINETNYNPLAKSSLNHKSYEYMIDELTDSGIQVLLLALPDHPQTRNYFREGQLDNFNHSFNYFSKKDNVQALNLYWEEWHPSMFRDRDHLGINGRDYFCEQFSVVLNELLINDGDGVLRTPQESQ